MNKLLMSLLATTLLASPALAEYVERNDFSRSQRTEYRAIPGSKTARGMTNAAVKTITTASKNTVAYTAEAVGILSAASQATVNRFIDAGACSARTRHPGEMAACGVDLGGGILAVVWKTAGYQGTNAAYYVGAVVGDWGQVWSEAFNACAAEMGPVAGVPCRVVAIVVNAAGQVVRVVAMSVGDTIGYTTQNGSLIIKSLTNVPSSLLRLDPEMAVYSVFGAVSGGICTAVDIVGIVPRIIGGIFGQEVGSACADLH